MIRTSGRAQYNVWDTETGYVYPEVYLGNKKILALGGGFDRQQNYKAYTADAQLGLPVGAAKNEFNGILTLYKIDGGKTFATLPEQSDLSLQAGYYLAPQKVMPFVRYEKQKFRAAGCCGRGAGDVSRGDVSHRVLSFS